MVLTDLHRIVLDKNRHCHANFDHEAKRTQKESSVTIGNNKYMTVICCTNKMYTLLFDYFQFSLDLRSRGYRAN